MKNKNKYGVLKTESLSDDHFSNDKSFIIKELTDHDLTIEKTNGDLDTRTKKNIKVIDEHLIANKKNKKINSIYLKIALISVVLFIIITLIIVLLIKLG